MIVAVAGSLAGHALARSADAPVFVIPGKPGVPVIINGYDASYSVVEGDWGLDRPSGATDHCVPSTASPPRARYYGTYFPAGT